MRSGEEALKQLLALLSSCPESWEAGACPGSCLSPALSCGSSWKCFSRGFWYAPEVENTRCRVALWLNAYFILLLPSW